MITIKQIAEIAGVSPSTVSNVIHGKTKKMSQETLLHVQKVLDEHNYVSNMGGRMLGRYGSKLIGVIMTYSHREERNATQDPFFSEIIGALEREIRTNGYFMMLYISGDVNESLRMAASWNVEGLIVQGCSADDCQYFMQNTDIPVVFIDCYFHDDGIRYVNVGLHDFRGGYMMTEYLIGQGHRRIAFLADQEVPVGVDYERLQGYKTALRDKGISFHAGDFFAISQSQNERHRKLEDFLDQRLKNYTALFFASDFYAVDTIHFLQDRGIHVPDDISICGFDDNIFAEQCRPGLTTVRQDISKKAVYAIQQILRCVRKEKIDPSNICLTVSLRIRDSVAPIAEPLE